MESYSQCGQDLFVLSLLKDVKGSFLDLGCSLPQRINNTYLLELNGWRGLSIDIQNFSRQWACRTNPFMQADCFNVDYNDILSKAYEGNTIDYLSLDIEVLGERFKLLEKVLQTGYEFKIITIEHDSYIGRDFELLERDRQRDILSKHGYVLLCSDVSHVQHPELFYEDWWVNPKYFNQSELETWRFDKTCCSKIFERNNIEYKLSEVSAFY